MPGPSFIDCDRDAQKSLHLSRRAARTKLIGGVGGLPGLDHLRRYMIARLSGARDLTITCNDCEHHPATDAYTLERGKGEIVLCRELFAGPQKRIDAVLFHELVHACGGDELDGEGLECHCFPEAATLPGRTDFRLFRKLPARNGYHLGQYLMWHVATGKVFVRTQDDKPGAQLNVRFGDTHR